jgi:2-iminobutanoate/2-iminopropanoate deaminase
MQRVILTAQAPRPIGPYSQGMVVPPFLYTAGQVGIDPATGALVDGGIAAEARQALANVRAIVEAAGGRLEDVVKTTVFLADMSEFQAFNAVYAQFFSHRPPARSTVAVAALPAGARVEIEAVAVWT